MGFIESVLSYILYLLYNFVGNLFDIVPIGTILSSLHQFHADVVFVILNTFIQKFAPNAGGGTNNYLINFLATIVYVIFFIFVLGLAALGVKYLYSGIGDYFFREKYKGLDDEEVEKLNNMNVISSGIDKTVAYKGFVGTIIQRIHFWKMNQVGAINKSGTDKLRFLGILTFTTAYLFGFFNSKELKEWRFWRITVTAIISVVFMTLFFKLTNWYYLGVLKEEGIQGNVVSIRENVAPKIERVNTNIKITNLSDLLSYMFLTIVTNDMYSSENLGKYAQIDGGNIRQTTFNSLLFVLNYIKDSPEAKEKLQKQINQYPTFIYSYMEGKIDEATLKRQFLKLPTIYSILIVPQLYQIAFPDSFDSTTSSFLNNVIASFSHLLYKWREYRSLYNALDENESLVKFQKFIYYLNLAPFAEPKLLVPINEAKALLGETQRYYGKVIDNGSGVDVTFSQQTIGEVKKTINNLTGSIQKTKPQYVPNPNIVYKVWGIFPVYPVSTSKNMVLLYYLFMLILALIQFIFLLLMMGLGRFIYLYLVWSSLDIGQKEKFEIDKRTEAIDLLIRIFATLVIYFYVLNAVAISPIL